MVARKRAKVKRKAASKKAHRKKTAKKAAKRAPKKKAAKKKPARKPAHPAKKQAAKKKAVRKSAAPTRKPAKKAANSRISAPRTLPERTLAERRSLAALKGWETRRANAALQKKRDKKTRQRQDKVFPEVKGIERDYQKTLERIEREAYERGIQAGLEQARMAEDEKRRLYLEQFKDWIESDETKIIARLRLAAEFGELDTEVWEVADDYDMDPSEIYDLFYSPGAE